MAKKSAIENNLRKQRMAKKFLARRKRRWDLANNEKLPMEERFEAGIRLAALPAQRRRGAHSQPLRSHRRRAVTIAR